MYPEFYGFTTPAFQLAPDPRFFFESTVHRKALAYMVYGLRQAEGFIVITGEVGAGKTILTNHLLATTKDDTLVTAKIVSSRLTGNDLLHLVATQFGIINKWVTKGPILQGINDFLVAQHRSGKRALLIVDEAQNLTLGALEELRMLSNILAEETAPLQSLLLGQPQFRATISSPRLEQFQQRITAAYHLAPLGQTETRTYIQHRLILAGWKGDPHFTDDSFQSIYRYTNGVPRLVNNLCSRLMLHGSLEQLHTFTATTVDGVASQLRQESAAVASKSAAYPVQAAKPAVADPVRKSNSDPNRSDVPRDEPSSRSARPEAPSTPSLPFWKFWKKETKPALATRSALVFSAAISPLVIVAVPAYLLSINSSISELTQIAKTAADKPIANVLSVPHQTSTPDTYFRDSSGTGPSGWDGVAGEPAHQAADVASAASASRQVPEPELKFHAPAAAAIAATSTSGSQIGEETDRPGGDISTVGNSSAAAGSAPTVSSGTDTQKEVPALRPGPKADVSPEVPPNQDISKTLGRTPSPDENLSWFEIDALVGRGDTFLSAGDVTSARLFYERAANAGSDAGAMRLGATFDPDFLSHAGIRGAVGDSKQAEFWYRRARSRISRGS